MKTRMLAALGVALALLIVLAAGVRGQGTEPLSPMAVENWHTTGNSGTTIDTDFLGTTDNNSLVLKTNNVEAMRIVTPLCYGPRCNGGHIGIGAAPTSAQLQVQSNDPVAVDAIFGVASNGVHGKSGVGFNSFGLGYNGVLGENTGGGNGVAGISDAAGGNGVYGEGSQNGVYATSPKGYGLYAWGGNGYAANLDGKVRAVILEIVGGSDVAEPFAATGADTIAPGSVVAIDPDHPGQIRLADRAYDRTVAGVVSGANGIRPGVTMKQNGTPADGSVPVSLSGRVYVSADASNGPIAPGDLLTTSDTPGHAMKVTDYARAQGAILGKAMSSLEQGAGPVLVLVTLQ